MPHRTRWRSAVVAATLAVALPLAATAQSQRPANEPKDVPPVIEGLGWYTIIDVAGPVLDDVFDEGEIEQWSAMLDVAGASIDDLDYSYQKVVDPATLPQLGGLATVRIVGATEDEVLAAVLADTEAQAAALGAEPPPSQPMTLGGKDVTMLDLPDVLGPDDAYVYVLGDTAWVFIMQESLAELGLQGMP